MKYGPKNHGSYKSRTIHARTIFGEVVVFSIVSIIMSGCYDSAPQSPDAQSDGSGDADELGNCDSCEGPVCISGLEGRVLYESGAPYEGIVSFCIGTACLTSNTDEDGRFYKDVPDGCRSFDFTKEEGIHLSLLGVQGGGWTQYSISYKPTQDEVSDKGADDFVLDMGDHYYYEVKGTGHNYVPESGLKVTDDEGLSFDIAAGDMGSDAFALHVLRFPLEKGRPPFVPEDLDLDVLYYLSPYYKASKAGIVYEIDSSVAGWSQEDSGKVYVLGDYADLNHLTCNGKESEVGVMSECGNATFENGKIVTDPIPLLGWFGVSR